MSTNLTNINVVGSPDYYLELESGKSWGYVNLTRDSTVTDIQLADCWVFYRFKLTRGDPSSDGITFYEIISDTSQHLTAFMENGIFKFRLSDGPDYTDIASINLTTAAVNLELNHWYDLVIYQDGNMKFSLRDSESGDELANDSYLQGIYFNISSWGLNFSASQAAGAVVFKDSRIEIQNTRETVLDLSGIEWDPVPSVSLTGTTNAI